jgi:hypothetical protein
VVAQLERLGDRGLVRGGDDDDAGHRAVGERPVDDPRLPGDRAGGRDVRERAWRVEQREPVTGRRRVDDDEVVRLGAGRAALGLGELPELAHRQQLAHARRRRGEVGEQAARREHLGERAGELVGEVLLHRRLGVDADRVQALGERDLAERTGLAGQRAADVVALGDLGDDRPPAVARGDEAERGGDGGLADPALAGDEDEPLVEQAHGRAATSVNSTGSASASRRSRKRPSSSRASRSPRGSKLASRCSRSASIRRPAARAASTTSPSECAYWTVAVAATAASASAYEPGSSRWRGPS